MLYKLLDVIFQVIPDLNLREYRASNRVSDYDQELLAQYQIGFFSEAKSTLPGKGKVALIKL